MGFLLPALNTFLCLPPLLPCSSPSCSSPAAIFGILGDLHGYRQGLEAALSALQGAHQLAASARAVLAQLGDIGVRGPDSVAVMFLVLLAKVLYPDQVVLVRGNHEVGGWVERDAVV
jgi:hypothetical protein